MRIDLARILRDAGLTVIEVDGWRGRGSALSGKPAVVVAHHTATGPNWSDQAVVNLLRNGRPDLRGPLAQVGLDRQGRYWVVTDGHANHNGYGSWGNQSVGIEAFNAGTGEPWPAAQVDAFVRGAAAILRHLGLPAARFQGHKETDPRRKIDPAGLDMDELRRQVAAVLAGGYTDDMPSEAFHRAETDRLIAAIEAQTVRSIQDRGSRLHKVNTSIKAILVYLKARFGPTSPAQEPGPDA